MPRWLKLSQLYEFIVFGVFGFLPLLLVAWKNARALPVGLLAFLSLVTVTFGFVVFVMSKPGNRAIPLLAGVVLLVLTVFAFRIAAHDLGSRIGWSVVSLVAWMMAINFGGNLIDNIKRDAGFAKSRVERIAEEAEIARKRAELEADPTKRRAVVAAQLAKYVESWKPFLNHARYITCGDPATDPEQVTVWAILTLTEHQRFDVFNHELKKLFADLNYSLRKEGYPWAVAAGAVDARDVAAAGGDARFFGADGSSVSPQWPATTTQAKLAEPLVPPLQPPERRTSL
ncbi:MAG: hypothetical protein ACJ8AK_06220 [Gemmatimonadaceae bacterium]